MIEMITSEGKQVTVDAEDNLQIISEKTDDDLQITSEKAVMKVNMKLLLANLLLLTSRFF